MEDSVKKAITDRDNAIIRQAFQLGDQDRKIRDLEATLAELQAGGVGDVGRLRQSVDLQAMEIQRLKAALWYGGKLDQVLIDILGTRPLGHDSEDGVWCWVDPDMDKAISAKLDAYKGKVAALTEDLAERDRLLRECKIANGNLESNYVSERHYSLGLLDTVKALNDELSAMKRTLKGAAADWDRSQAKIADLTAERDEARRKLALKANAMLAGQKRNAELEAEVGALKGDAMIKTHYAAGLLDSVKALNDDLAAAKKWIVDLTAERDEAKAAAKRGTDEAKRLAAIADHSNALAQNRLEEAARLRKELVVAREATAKLEAKMAEFE